VGGVRFARCGVFLTALIALACSGRSQSGGDEPDAGEVPESARVELGVPSGEDGLDFAAIEDGAVLKLQTFGQGGTHVFLGVRCLGFGNRAFVGFRLTNLTNGREILAPPPVRPQLLYCHEDDEETCDLVPVTVMTGGLTDPDEERHDLPIRIDVDVSNVDGETGAASREVRLSTEDLTPLR
jgi:hypothetical protein